MWNRGAFSRVEYAFSKPALFLVGSIGLMLPVTVWGSLHYARAGDVADAVVLGVVSVPLLVLDVWVWHRLLTSKPALVLTEDALVENASVFGAGRVDRQDIAAVRVETQGWWRMVRLDLHPGARRLLTPAIPTFLLGVSAETLAADVREWLKSGPRS